MTWVQPVLTANGTIGQSEFAVASGGGAESDAYKAFDSSASSYCNKMNSGAWLSFYSKTWLVISDILITSDQSLPSQGIFQVSYDNGATWEHIGSWRDTAKTGRSAHIIFDEGVATGNYFRFVSQGRSLAKPSNNADFCNVVITADEATTGTRVFFADVERVVKNNAYIKQIAQSLSVWLRFDESTTADKCGGTWTAIGSPVIENGALKLDGASYLKRTGGITLGGRDFTICGLAKMDADTTRWYPGIFAFNSNQLRLIGVGSQTSNLEIGIKGSVSTVTTSELTKEFHYEIDYHHASGKWQLFINGTQVFSKTSSLSRTTYANAFVGSNGDSSPQFWGGTLDEFMIYDGVALHTENFTSPTAAEYDALAFQLDSHVSFTVDVERRISNRVEFTVPVERKIINAWRYYNAGTADKLTVTGTTLENLPATKSVTGTAFYQTTRDKCFDLPATDEVWLKFDVYFDGSNRWRAYNGGTNGTTGITAQQTDSNKIISVFSNATNVQQTHGFSIPNQLQTVILHMVSGATAGVVEAWVDGTKIHTYTGDVNHGEEFADIYLQSDGAGTFFSNVVISNRQLTQADGYQSFTADVERKLGNHVEVTFDVERQVFNSINVEFSADVKIIDVVPVEFTTDVEVCDFVPSNFIADVAIFDMIRVEFAADVMRSIIGKVKLFAGDNSAYFEENPVGEELKPVVIPSQSLTDIGRSPAAPNNTNSLQSVEIEIAEQQITENVHFVGVVPFDIMYPVRGQYLDYLIDMRVERVQKHGILYSCDCCSDLDALLYTQIAYTVPKSTDWHGAGDTSEEVETATNESTPAIAHAKNLANVLGKTPVIQFAPFNSTVMMDDSGGVTYGDLIREIFGWTSRVPTMLINVFIRGDKIYFVQRGYEARSIDLSFTQHTIPTVTHDLVRMTWGSTPWSKSETREQKSFNWKPEEYDYSDVYDPDAEETIPEETTPEETTPQDGDEETWVTVEDVSTGIDWIATTTYQYYPKSKVNVEGSLPNVLGGLLAKVVTSKHSTDWTKPDSYTEITHAYDKDRNKIQTVTTVHYSGGDETPKDTKTINLSNYITLPNGEKFLASESTWSYEGNKLVDSTTTTHSPGRQGQTHTIKFDSDGEIVGEVFGQDTGDDRVTPFSQSKANSLEQGTLATYRYNGETGEWEKIGEWKEETDTQSRTVNGLSLYDSSFPVHGTGKLTEITNAIKWLNRRTKETVTMTIYEYPHLIDFNDRIIFEGNVYFLVSNMATTTERIFNEQRITMVRWY